MTKAINNSKQEPKMKKLQCKNHITRYLYDKNQFNK